MMSAPTIVSGSWRLGGGRFGWPASATSGLTVAEQLTLTPNPDGPRSLRSADETLGGLTLPPWIAVGNGVVWLVNRELAALRRFDPLRGRFVTVVGWGGRSSGAQWFGGNASISATGGHLAIADRDRSNLVIVATGPFVVSAVLSLGGRRPIAVTAHAGRFHVLDDRGGIWVTTPALDRLNPQPRSARMPHGSWERVVVDRDGRPYRADTTHGALLVSVPNRQWDLFGTADEVRSRFPEPLLTFGHRGRFRVPSGFRVRGSDPTPLFDKHGEHCVVAPGEYAGEPPFEVRGWWTSNPFDSRELGCRWHRLTVTGTRPFGSTTTIETYTSDQPNVPKEIPPDAWSREHLLGQTAAVDAPVTTDHAIVSPGGRYLTVRIGLRGDGWATPSVEGLLVEPEAAGLDRFLPAVYRSADQDEGFLRRFLAIFGTEFDRVEQSLRSLPARFSPATVPDALLDVLATELGVPLERSWTASQRRAMLMVAPRWHRSRGTPAAIHALLHAHLAAATGRPLPDSVPALVEGFRERPAATLGRVRVPMEAGQTAWSDEVVDRPRLGGRGQDRISLVSAGDRQTDRFRVHANRFKIVVPRPLLPSDNDRASFERLITAEKPAHVAHELVVVDAQTTIGTQGFLGVDTYVGAWPVARLARTGCAGTRLGLGLRLGRRGPALARPPAVGRGGRLDIGTVLV